MVTEKIKGLTKKGLAIKFARKKFNNGYEIGTLRGRYAKVLCAYNRNLKLKTVDIFDVVPGDKASARLGKDTHKVNYDIAQYRLKKYNCEIINKTSLEAVQEVPYNSIDFVYIDASHHFDYVMEDIIEWSKRVRKGGIVSGHDYNSKIWPDVVLAVNTYVKAHNIKTLYLTDERTSSWWFVKT